MMAASMPSRSITLIRSYGSKPPGSATILAVGARISSTVIPRSAASFWAILSPPPRHTLPTKTPSSSDTKCGIRSPHFLWSIRSDHSVGGSITWPSPSTTRASPLPAISPSPFSEMTIFRGPNYTASERISKCAAAAAVTACVAPYRGGSMHGRAAVGKENRAGIEFAFGAGQKQRRIGDVIGLAIKRKHSGLLRAFDHVDVILRHWSVHQARPDGVGGDPVLRQF